MITDKIANSLISMGRSIGRLGGNQLAVEVSEHSIKTEMESPDKTERAWDTDLYKRGNLFVAGYANPIKPRVQHNEELENPNTVEAEDGEPDDGSETPGDVDAKLISSGRYQEFMRQDLISQLLTPETRWNKLLYGMLAIGAIGFFQIIVTLYATGSFQ